MTKKDYLDSIKSLEKIRGKSYIKKINDFLNEIYKKQMNRQDQVDTIWQTYKLEKTIRLIIYKYIEIIRYSFWASLENNNKIDSFINALEIKVKKNHPKDLKKTSNKDLSSYKFSINELMKEIKKHPECQAFLSKENKIYCSNFELTSKDQEIIRKTRNLNQHFTWILTKENLLIIKNFIKLLSKKYQEFFQKEIVINIFKIITNQKVVKDFIKYFKKNSWFKNEPLLKKILKIPKKGLKQKCDENHLKIEEKNCCVYYIQLRNALLEEEKLRIAINEYDKDLGGAK